MQVQYVHSANPVFLRKQVANWHGILTEINFIIIRKPHNLQFPSL